MIFNMCFRYFVALCAVALCAVAVNVEIEEDVQVHDIDINIEERANYAAKVVAKYIGSLFIGAAVNCLGEAAINCNQHWKNPGASISCAKNFLGNNQGRCALGK